jgi:hypothetical protein
MARRDSPEVAGPEVELMDHDGRPQDVTVRVERTDS